MEDTTQARNFHQTSNTAAQRERRKITRDTSRAYFAVCRAAGLEPNESRTAFAISTLCYETQAKDYSTPRKLSLDLIGGALTSTEDVKKDAGARWKKAQRDVSHLFCQALPRVGLQLLARFKSAEDGKAHEYADYAMAVAGIVAEEFDKARAAILSSDAKAKAIAIDAAMAGLAAEALKLFDKLDVAIVGPDRKVFAVVSAPQAKAFCEQNPTYKPAEYKYTPPADPTKNGPRPFDREDFAKMIDLELTRVEKRFYEIEEKNTPEEARLFLANWLTAAKNKAESLVRVSGMATERRRDREIIHVSENGGVGVSEASEPIPEPTQTYDILSWVGADKPNEASEIVFSSFEHKAEASVNFETSLEAALFSARDGFPVLPVCNFNPDADRCTATWHDETCRGRVPLVKGDGTPGYPQASKDLEQIRKWYAKYPDAGVALRMDGHILIDADAKDGGPESYRILADTFDLPETLTAITQSGDGRHYVFKLPEGLPDAWLKSWVRVGDKVELPGLDIKVDKCGLMFVEPTRGPKGVYRWIDPTSPPATLPREVCDFLHEARYKGEKEKQEKAKAARASASDSTHGVQPFDPNQEKFFRDVPEGERRPRLLRIARSIRASGGDADQIKTALKYHASRFSSPLNDDAWIERTSRECVAKYAPEVAAR